jgi:hypothetical protein
MSLGIPASQFFFIEQDFANIIKKCEDGAFGDPDNPPHVRRKTYFFCDDSYLIISESVTQHNEIERFYYHWLDKDNKPLQIFHGHYHPPGTPRNVTKYDPFHVHIPKRDYSEFEDLYDFLGSISEEINCQ